MKEESAMLQLLEYPLDPGQILRKRRKLKKILQEKESRQKFQQIKVAILGGSTTAEVAENIDLFLLKENISVTFYESDFNKYYEEAVFENTALREFAPDLVYLHTNVRNILEWPNLQESDTETEQKVDREYSQIEQICDELTERYGCIVILNNYEYPLIRMLGNMDAFHNKGYVSYVNSLNEKIYSLVNKRENVYLNDINYLSAKIGHDTWFDEALWNNYRYAIGYEAIPHLANNVASIVKGIYGKSKKCLVLDLDNTLWGGIIGDDGLEGISLGTEDGLSEAFRNFQRYVKDLKNKGIILAVCSKNEETAAKSGFDHPESILKLEDFGAFIADWEPKSLNIAKIAEALNIGKDSLVFVDDNPAERDIVRGTEPDISVPEMGTDITRYPGILDQSGLFELTSLSAEDLQRSSYYKNNQIRETERKKYNNYEEYLKSLEMQAQIEKFEDIYMDRITQLINKTNQFNLTTTRYTREQLEEIRSDNSFLALYGKLDDKFGSNGIISVIIGRQNGSSMEIVLWLMSCRVFNRQMEFALFDEFVAHAKKRGVTTILGRYLKTEKNNPVKDLYRTMGFTLLQVDNENNSEWILELGKEYTNKNTVIDIQEKTR